MLYEMEMFRKVGGGSIVENTSHGLKRNLGLMVQISQQTGVNIIAGTG
jgi:phosphotriesterase-related protein